MYNQPKFRIAVFFTILFMALISVPTVIASFDDTVDVSCFFGVGEEEEESKNLKLLFEVAPHNLEDSFADSNRNQKIGYTFKNYPKPHLNLIFPPPEFI